MDLVGKTAVVVGGFGGIGFEVCKCLLQAQIKSLGIFDQKENTEKINHLGGKNITFCKMDITRKPEIERAYDDFIRKAGPIDLMIHAAGIMDDRKLRLTVEINLIGLMESTLTAISHMNKINGGKGGLIVNISSVLGIEPGTATAIYSGSKFGVVGFTKSLAHDFYYQQNGVKFIVICPGITVTPLIDNVVGVKDTFEYSRDITSFLSRAKSQTAKACAKNIIKSIEQAENGSIFICDLGELRSVELAKLWEIQFK